MKVKMKISALCFPTSLIFSALIEKLQEVNITKMSGIYRSFSTLFFVYPGSESNRYGRNGHRILSPACLPVPPPGQ